MDPAAARELERQEYPYFVFPAVGFGVLALGALYWALWLKLLPRLGGCRVVSERTYGDDGVEVVRYRKVAVGGRCWIVDNTKYCCAIGCADVEVGWKNNKAARTKLLRT